MKKFIALTILLTGLWFLTSSSYMKIKAELSQYLIHEAWQDTLIDKQNHKPWSWADTYPLMQLTIPSIGKSSYVLQGESGRNMAFSVVHLSSSGMPGDLKSTIVSGHNDSHFGYLDNVRLGDEIIAKDKYASYSYRITKIEIVDSSIKRLEIRNTNELILTTCYPFNDLQIGGDLRFVVYASPTLNTIKPENKFIFRI